MSTDFGAAAATARSHQAPPHVEGAVLNSARRTGADQAHDTDRADPVAGRHVEIPIPLASSMREYRSRLRFGPLVGSILLHLVLAAAVLAVEFWWLETRWILPVKQGKDSIELQASFASPPPAESDPIVVERPERMPRETPPPEPQPPELQPPPTEVQRRPSLPEVARNSVAELQEDVETMPEPIAESLAPLELADASEARPVERRKPQAKPVAAALPRDPIASMLEESLASEASAADSGSDEPQVPAVVYNLKPKYPPASEAAGEQGIVKILFRIDDSGRVLSATLHKSSGFARLDQATLDVVYQLRFAAADGGSSGRRATTFIKPFLFTKPSGQRAP